MTCRFSFSFERTLIMLSILHPTTTITIMDRGLANYYIYFICSICQLSKFLLLSHMIYHQDNFQKRSIIVCSVCPNIGQFSQIIYHYLFCSPKYPNILVPLSLQTPAGLQTGRTSLGLAPDCQGSFLCLYSEA